MEKTSRTNRRGEDVSEQTKIWTYEEVEAKIAHDRGPKLWKNVFDVLNQPLIIHEVELAKFVDDEGTEREYIKVNYFLNDEPGELRTSGRVLIRQLLEA